ncbi:MAG: hypothetical protein WBB28_12225 [Crinalium sp.]
MRYLFTAEPNDTDFIFKISFDILINEPNLIEIFKNLLTWKEDEVHELWGFSFFDEYEDPVEEVTVWYLDKEKKYSKSEFNKLITMAINHFFCIYPDPKGKEEIDKFIDLSEI